MSNHNVRDLIIIGGGPAGLTAGLYASRAGVDTLLLEKMTPGGQVATIDMIENYPGMAPIAGMKFMQNLELQSKSYGLKIINYKEAERVEVENRIKLIITTEGEIFKAKALIIATGAQPRSLNVDGEDRLKGKGVSYCAICDGPFYRDKDIAVIGGGNAAIQEALFLTTYARTIKVIHRRETLRASQVLQERAFKNPKISFLWNSVVTKIVGEQKIEALQIEDKKTGEHKMLPIEGVFIYVGFVPQSYLVKDLVKLDSNGYIITDEKMRTSVPGIFSAGDVRTTPLRQVVTSAGDGAIAAMLAVEYIHEN